LFKSPNKITRIPYYRFNEKKEREKIIEAIAALYDGVEAPPMAERFTSKSIEKISDDFKQKYMTVAASI
jgi:hypothetical protein